MLFGKTRHAFYDKKWYLQEKAQHEHIILEMVAEIRREIPGIGTPKLYHLLKAPLRAMQIKTGRDALHRLLLDQGLTVIRKKRYCKTTDSNHWMKKYPNLIRKIKVQRPEQIWVADITYLIVGQDFNFLSLITDAYSKLIVGYCLYPTLEAEGVLNALRMALKKKTGMEGLIHHSDRGTQYCCGDYVELLKGNRIQISMTEKGDPYENAIAERVNGILKGEFRLNADFKTRDDALLSVEKSIYTYNYKRPHMSCNNLTPFEAHCQSGELKKLWKPKPPFNQLKEVK